MTAPQDVRRRVRETIRRHGMIAPGDRVLVAVSGGPDSVCLLRVLADLAEGLDCGLACAHVHHGLRGADADADAAFVESLAEAWGVPCDVHRGDPAAWHVAGRSTQESAREMRYDALRAIAGDRGAARIATGHTATDQAETVLLRILEGTGTAGLRGILPVRDRVIRPLIGISRADVIAFLTSQGIGWREDASNDSGAYDRNRIRRDLLPLLREGFNPRVDEALARLADAAQGDEEAVDWAVRGRIESVAVERGEVVEFPLDALAGLPRGLRLRVIRALLSRAAGTLHPPLRAHVEAVEKLSDARTSARATLPGGRIAEVDGASLRIGTEEALAESEPEPVGIDGPGTYSFGDWEIQIEPAPEVPAKPWPADTTYLGADALAGSVLRTWKSGDRIEPEGMDGSRKLQDLFTDAGVPARERRRTPLLVRADGVLWVCGLRRSRRGLAGPGASDTVRLQVRRPAK